MNILTCNELFKGFIGQTNIKNMLYDMYYCSVKHGHHFPHTLLIASAGQGKTKMSSMLAHALCDEPIEVYAPSISSWDDMRKVLNQVSETRNILFIDEVHSLPKDVQEMFYTLMTDYKVYNKKSGQYTRFPRFTILAATTDPQYMLRPFMDRFINTMVFTKYSKNDMLDLFRNTFIPEFFENDVIDKFVSLSHNTPRKFHSLVTRFKYYIDSHECLNKITMEYFDSFLAHIGLNAEGFNSLQQQYISILKALNSPASLGTLANLMELKQEVITQIVEPDIIAAGYVTISSSGRKYNQPEVLL